ncbi:unnamed protein product [Gordionus sp. m RMFG-2023]|uniref:uncharacterized protein LOC135922061 isoform X2 n=1 Tax=Gordionus sp. m RMFG-2023 TaxID=3053472 RepID=UPI0030E4713A
MNLPLNSLEIPLHDIIKQSVEEFKIFWNEQKSFNDEISQFSCKIFGHINEDIKNSQNDLNNLKSKISKYTCDAQNLKDKILKETKQSEYFSRIRASNNVYNFLNKTDLEYYNDLVIEYQEQIKNISQNLKDVKNYLDSSHISSPKKALDSQTLIGISKYLQELIIIVASNLQTVHELIQSCKIRGPGFGNLFQPSDSLHILKPNHVLPNNFLSTLPNPSIHTSSKIQDHKFTHQIDIDHLTKLPNTKLKGIMKRSSLME